MFIKKKLEIIQAISQKLIRDLAKNCYKLNFNDVS